MFGVLRFVIQPFPLDTKNSREPCSVSLFLSSLDALDEDRDELSALFDYDFSLGCFQEFDP